MYKYTKNTSNYILVGVLAGAGFIAQPTIASGIYLLFIILPGLLVLKLYGHYEGYQEAHGDYAPEQPIKGHMLYQLVEWLETPHFGIKGIWVVLGVVVALTFYRWFH